jgi:hypothetical protein
LFDLSRIKNLTLKYSGSHEKAMNDLVSSLTGNKLDRANLAHHH